MIAARTGDDDRMAAIDDDDNNNNNNNKNNNLLGIPPDLVLQTDQVSIDLFEGGDLSLGHLGGWRMDDVPSVEDARCKSQEWKPVPSLPVLL